MKDSQGLPLSGASTDSQQAYSLAQEQFACYRGDPLALVEQALQASPAMTMAHVFKAWLHLLGTEPSGLLVAQASCEAASRLPATQRERRHLQAIQLLVQGHWHEAGHVLEDLSLHDPRDLLALQAGHQIDYFTGDARMLRDRIARALPAWQRGLSGYHAVLGMHAFGLEECGDYVAAEKIGRRAVELEPRDGWAWHAVAHVHEMRNDPDAGIAWLGAHPQHWAAGSMLAVHNWWHLALFHLELGNEAEVLRLYDEAIASAGSVAMLDLIDASAMLWRLQLRDVGLGARWQQLAARWQQTGTPGLYAFNDMHMMMAHVGAGDMQAQQTVLEAQRAALRRDDDNAVFTREVGYPVARALQAYGLGEYGRCVDLLRRIRSGAHRFGGSHAQRDVIDLTLLEAARRGALEPLSAALAFERLSRRPRTVATPQLALAA